MLELFLLLSFVFIIFKCGTNVVSGLKAEWREMFESDDDYRTYP